MKCYHTYLIWQTKVMQSMKQTEEFKIYNKTREWKKIIAIYKKQKNLNYPKTYLWIKINYEVEQIIDYYQST